MLFRSTCFCDVGYFPSDIARLAVAQGLRAVIGLPVAEHPSPWAQNAGEYLSRALRLRDEYKGHPTLSVSFAPLRPAEIEDATFARLGVLVDELDAGVLLALHESEGAPGMPASISAYALASLKTEADLC